jgi:hypothetical protein
MIENIKKTINEYIQIDLHTLALSIVIFYVIIIILMTRLLTPAHASYWTGFVMVLCVLPGWIAILIPSLLVVTGIF